MAEPQWGPQLTDAEWQDWFDSPGGVLACLACNEPSAAFWNGRDETLTWSGCGHTSFFPDSPVPWPPPTSHIRR